MPRKQYTIGDLFTDAEVAKALGIYNQAPFGTFARRCAADVVTPALDRINKKTGQENDALYLAYMIEHSFISAGRGKKR